MKKNPKESNVDSVWWYDIETRYRNQLSISLVFISQSYFKVTKTTKLNTLFYHENTYQKGTSTNSIKLFI